MQGAATGGFLCGLFETERREAAASGTYEYGFIAGEVDYRRRLARTRAAVDHQVDLFFEACADVLRVVQRLGFTGHDQRRTEQRLAEFFEDRERDRVIGHTQTDR